MRLKIAFFRENLVANIAFKLHFFAMNQLMFVEMMFQLESLVASFALEWSVPGMQSFMSHEVIFA